MKKILSIVLALVLALSLTACGKETVSLNDYLKVEFSGSNGTGKATVTGFADFEEDVMQKLGGEVTLMQLAVLEDGIDYELDKKDGLSNGDKVKLTISIDEDIKDSFDVNIVGKDMEFTVSGLPEKVYEEVNPFEDGSLKIDITGNSPYIRVKAQILKRKNLNEEVKVSTPANGKFFKNGETVKITYTYDEAKAEENSIKIVETEKEIKIEDHDYYPLSWNEFSKEHQDKLVQAVTDFVEADSTLTNFWTEEGKLYRNPAYVKNDTPVNPQYLGNYFFYPKDEALTQYDPNVCNSMFFVYSMNLANSDTAEIETVYSVVYVKNISVTSDGHLVFDNTMLDHYHYFLTSDRIYNSVVVRNKSDYHYEENISFE